MINFLSLFLNPIVIFVLIIFIIFIVYINKKLKFIYENLTKINNFIFQFKKDNLIYRFKEFDEFMSANSIISEYWIEFRSTLIFNDAIYTDSSIEDAEKNTIIKTTFNPTFFFNENTLVKNQYNYKFTQTIPTLLTGLGPMFTFLHIVIGFSMVDFSSQERTMSSVSSLMSNIKIGALISVIAVGSALIYMFVERILYEIYCRKPLKSFQHIMNNLFDSISSEKFLITMLNDNRIQNEKVKENFEVVAKSISESVETSISNLVPYLENIIYSINKLKGTDSSKDLLKKLFKEDKNQ